MKQLTLLIIIILTSFFTNTYVSAKENKKEKLKYRYEGNDKILKYNGFIFRADKSVSDLVILRSHAIIDAMLANDEYMQDS